MIADLAAKLIRLICGASIRGETELPEQAVYFANHTSHLDALLIWASLPPGTRRRTRPVAAREYWTRFPWRRWLADRVFNAILIDRRRVTREDNPVRHFIQALRTGASLIIFPEGTRGATDKIAPFKAGLFHLARAGRTIPLIPLHLANLNRILPRGEILPVPFLSTINFGHPFQLEDTESKSQFLARTRNTVVSLHES
jgi:1-acyl-sn-glycerol-3-phosphate acyltransferase